MSYRKIASLLCGALLISSPSFAQTANVPNVINGTDSTGFPITAPVGNGSNGSVPMPVSASVSVSGFTPNGNYASPLSVSNSTANVALPTGAVVLVSNPGSTAAYVNLGTSNAVTATTSDILIPAGANVGLTVGSNTYLAAITASSTTTLNLSGGTGIVAGYGGSSSGGGSSGAVYGPTAVGSAAANPPVLAGGTADGTATGNVGVLKIVSGVGSVNTAQVNGVTTLTGAGAVGTGSARVAVGQDTTTVAGAAPTTTGIYVTGPSAAALATGALQTSVGATAHTDAAAINTTLGSPMQTSGGSVTANAGTNLNTSALATSANQIAVTGTKAAGTAAANSELVGGVYNSSLPTLTTGQQSAAQFDSSGRLIVNVGAGGGSGGTSSSFGSAFPSTGTAIGASDGTNMQGLEVDGSGNLKIVGGYAQESTTSGQTGGLDQGAVTTSAPTYTTAKTAPLSLDTAGNLRVNVTTASGVAQGSTTSGQTVSPIGCRTLTSAPTDTTAQTNIPWCTTSGSLVVAQPTAANLNATVVGTGTFAVQAAQATAASLNATVVGTGTFATQSTPTTAATGGATPYTLTAANSTNATNIKASAGTLYHVAVYNNGVSTAPLAWVSFYNTAGTPTCGTSIVYQTQIPVNSTNGAGAVEDFADGLAFSTGIGICVTTGIAGTGSVAASTYTVSLGFK